MTNPVDFYKSQIDIHSETLKRTKRKLAISSTLRLLVFLTACVAVYFTFGNAMVVVPIVLLASALFVALVSRHGKLIDQRDLTLSLLSQNEVEIEVLNRVFHHLPSGEKYKDPLHYYSQDIDLFGRGSFFQYANRTTLESGSDFLAKLMTQNSIENIERKQEVIKELSGMAEWRQYFSGIASLVKNEVSSREVTEWMENHTNFVPKWARKVSWLFSAISVGLIFSYFIGLVSGYWAVGWFFLGLAIT